MGEEGGKKREGGRRGEEEWGGVRGKFECSQ